MVEVFRTNIKDEADANLILEQMHHTFINYEANFDLDDCDSILRVECKTGLIQAAVLIDHLKTFGCAAEVLPEN